MREYEPAYQIQPTDCDLAREFRDQPFGPHSPDLVRLLNRLRGDSLSGKVVLFSSRRHSEWKLASLSGPIGPITVYDEPVFHDRGEAEWEVFKLRWQRETKIEHCLD